MIQVAFKPIKDVLEILYMMPLILNIDTATEHASICLNRGETILGQLESDDQKHHGAFLQPAIESLMRTAGISLVELDAIAVTAGPGSYTGLRVGLASAKGLCYVWQKPLIMINTLEVMAAAAIRDQPTIAATSLFCPMIDARRMEVFCACYDPRIQILQMPQALILDADSFSKELSESTIVFSGSGAAKFMALQPSERAIYSKVQHDASDLATLALNAFGKKRFSDLAYAEPVYLKAFHSTDKKILP